ncbi:hypothetical protein AcV5_003250 [Taiwanofungus camphoratus]|nr:hypothetical protein AcV5_003250 [Antrodia cinnamomea]KAI0929404.1 hypothetical protein AcV7_005266 [Antrodia cinnamomea]
MVFKFVYRALRQASDWALGFYSEIQVDGVENVPKYGPVIVVSSHHNEILDIATLAVTIPHRRTLCFWAKSTLFKSPLVRAVLLSSGSIPVRRATKTDTSIANLHQALFFETFRTLDAGEAVGVFPEGTSYTEPQIAQIKDGAAWAALEYMRWRKVNNGDGEENANRQLLIIPVGIVYTGKSQYQSRVCVRWGKPIDIMSYAEKYLEGPENDVRAIIRSLSKEIERRLMQVTVNAPDWDTLHIATVARDILYGSEKNIPLERYVTVSQTLIDLFASSEPSPSLSRAKRSLIRYYSLLYHCDISHGTLSVVLPPSRRWPTRPQAAYIFARQITITFLHPRSFLFFPVFILHIPAYFIGWLAGRVLASPSYEETQAQYKAILGGLGAEAVYLLVGSVVTRALGSMIDAHSLRDSMRSPSNKTELGLQVLCKIGMWFFKIGGVQSVGGRVKRLLGVCGILYGTAWVLSKWHNALVGG